MVLTVHHLQRGQSERIVWLCEELGLDYNLKTYQRNPKTYMSPPELANLHPTRAAPIIEDDGGVLLAESGAITEYILTKYGGGKLAVGPAARNYADYLYWLHFSNGYFQPALSKFSESSFLLVWFCVELARQCMFARFVPSVALTKDWIRGLSTRADVDFTAVLAQRLGADPAADDAAPSLFFVKRGRAASLSMLDERLASNAWLAGDEFTAADIMTVWSCTTMRLFTPYSLEGYEGILGWLERVGEREAYRRAMGKGDPGLEPLLGREAPEFLQL